MLLSTVLQWPCNAILHSGPSGRSLWASISCQRDQRSIFSLGLSCSAGCVCVCGGGRKTNHGNGAAMAPFLLLKVTCTHVCSVHCSVPHELTWQDDIDPELHESCTIESTACRTDCALVLTVSAAVDSRSLCSELVQCVWRLELKL